MEFLRVKRKGDIMYPTIKDIRKTAWNLIGRNIQLWKNKKCGPFITRT